ncbi:MAG: MarR family transcriptional regulator [Candidatus Dormibacteraeota bacterium]|nr:MarR family transcriptional regulator [Candidatus Dormibacteraeota bacterium]
MKSFTMNNRTMKPAETAKLDITAMHELARDDSGRLYSVRMRQLFDPLQVNMSVVEAMAALRIAGRALHHLHERWADQHGLSEGRLGVLFRLYRCGPTPLGDLAADLDSTPRNITGLVDHLEKDGLVERVPDPDDRRSVHARLTEAGRVRIEAIWKEGLEHQHEIAEGLSKDDLVQLRHLCLQLVENARKELGK